MLLNKETEIKPKNYEYYYYSLLTKENLVVRILVIFKLSGNKQKNKVIW